MGTETPGNSHATSCTSYTAVGSNSIRRSTGEGRKLTDDGTWKKPSAVTTRSKTMDKEKDPVSKKTTKNVVITKQKGIKGERRKKRIKFP